MSRMEGSGDVGGGGGGVTGFWLEPGYQYLLEKKPDYPINSL